jgi:hypothetical protein
VKAEVVATIYSETIEANSSLTENARDVDTILLIAVEVVYSLHFVTHSARSVQVINAVSACEPIPTLKNLLTGVANKFSGTTDLSGDEKVFYRQQIRRLEIYTGAMVRKESDGGTSDALLPEVERLLQRVHPRTQTALF